MITSGVRQLPTPGAGLASPAIAAMKSSRVGTGLRRDEAEQLMHSHENPNR
jgi:hypothetical protein